MEELTAELHHRHRHPLHAAGGARLPAHRLLPSRQPGGGGADRDDLQQPEGPAHPGLHHRPVRMSRAMPTRSERFANAERNMHEHTVKSYDAGAAAARQEGRADGRAAPSASLAQALRGAGAARLQARPGGRSPATRPSTSCSASSRSRRSYDCPAPADGQRPAPHHDGAPHRQRPGAHRRPGQEHRQARRSPSRREPTSQVADAGLAPMAELACATSSKDVLDAYRRARRGDSARRVAAGRAHRRAVQLAVPRAPDLHDGGPAQHRLLHASAVRRQEHRAGRRPRHQHRRDTHYLVHGRHALRRPAEGRRNQLGADPKLGAQRD